MSSGKKDSDDTPQVRTGRSRPLDVLPIWVLFVLILILVWGVVRENVPIKWLQHWPWRLGILSVSAAAALAGTLAALVLARRQFALASGPHLGWDGFTEHEGSSLGERTRWYVELVNSGGGLAMVTCIRYRISPRGQAFNDSGWRDVDSARYSLAHDLGLTEDKDFALTRISVGAGIAAGKDGVFEAMVLSGTAYYRLSAVDVCIDFDSVAGDHYRRLLHLIPRLGSH